MAFETVLLKHTMSHHLYPLNFTGCPSGSAPTILLHLYRSSNCHTFYQVHACRLPTIPPYPDQKGPKQGRYSSARRTIAPEAYRRAPNAQSKCCVRSHYKHVRMYVHQTVSIPLPFKNRNARLTEFKFSLKATSPTTNIIMNHM